MSLNIKLWRRILPHVVSNLEVSLFRYSSARTLLTNSSSFNLSNRHLKETQNSISSHWPSSLSREICTSKVWNVEEGKETDLNKKVEGGDEGSQAGGNDDQLINGDSTKEGARGGRAKNRGYLKDRTKFIPVEVSMRYIKSSGEVIKLNDRYHPITSSIM